MKALVYKGPGKKAWEEVPDPVIKRPTDAIVKIETTTICGTDLHILLGDVPAVKEGTILGHEGVGVITEVGDAVENLKVGDRVILSCVTSCGRCAYCKQGLYSHCLAEEGAPGIGWIFGHLIDGTQAEYVRVPYAETSVYKLPESVKNTEGVLLSDILPTGFEIGVKYGKVKPGDIVAVVGAGPVGLAAIMTAQLYNPAKIIAIDLDENRLEEARKFGATHTVKSDHEGWQEEVISLSDGLGVDVAMEAVGIPATLLMCFKMVRAGGTVANIGVHGKSVELPIDELWIRDIGLTMGLVSTNTLDVLLKMVESKKLDASLFTSHEMKLDDIIEAYDIFSRAAETKALKIMLHNE